MKYAILTANGIQIETVSDVYNLLALSHGRQVLDKRPDQGELR